MHSFVALRLAARREVFVLAGASVAALLVLGCSSKSTTGGTTGTGGNSGCNPAEAQNTEFCAMGAPKADCSNQPTSKHQVCGVALPEPKMDLQRSANVMEYAGSGAPQVGCFSPSGYPAPPATPQMVTVNGLAKIFSSGCNSNNLKITIYKVKRTNDSHDGELDTPVGTPITTDADCMTSGVAVADSKCTPSRYECKFSYANVPTETELAIKTEGAPTWAPLIQYNIFIRNNQVMNGSYTYDVRALAAEDYTAIPAASIGGPVTAGHGVLAGEVHDCGDVRLIGAVADISQFRVKALYFGSDEQSPLPDLSAESTSTLGLYAAFDVKPGPVTVAAMGKLNGQDVALGIHHVQIYPDSVTSVTFKGLQPYQLPH